MTWRHSWTLNSPNIIFVIIVSILIMLTTITISIIITIHQEDFHYIMHNLPVAVDDADIADMFAVADTDRFWFCKLTIYYLLFIIARAVTAGSATRSSRRWSILRNRQRDQNQLRKTLCSASRRWLTIRRNIWGRYIWDRWIEDEFRRLQCALRWSHCCKNPQLWSPYQVWY